MTRRSPSFTLIELLVVIAIISLLALLTLPALSKARQRAAIVKCASQLRQIGLGVRTYLADHSNFFPPVTQSDWGTRGSGWISETYYLSCVNDEYDVFRCPRQNADLGAKYTFPSAPTKRVTYEYNPLMTCTDTNVLFSATSRYISSPASCPYVWEVPYDDASAADFPHVNGMNVLYVDGHVAWLPASEYAGASNQWYNTGFAP
jgi:prepilin-type processing-associated H-X9-DG protein/prepilin-type N-terminal cleavage/methylation domain-containing protein